MCFFLCLFVVVLNLCDTWLKYIWQTEPARLVWSGAYSRTILSLPSISTLHQCNAAMLMWVAKLPYSLDYQNAGYFLYSPYFPEFAPFASEQNFPSLALLPSASRSLATEQSYHVRHICNLRKLASRPSFPSLLGAPSMLQIWKKMFVNKSWVTSTKVLIK